MPRAFSECVRDGGRVRTKRIGKTKFTRFCFLNGKSFKGETKTRKK